MAMQELQKERFSSVEEEGEAMRDEIPLQDTLLGNLEARLVSEEYKEDLPSTSTSHGQHSIQNPQPWQEVDFRKMSIIPTEGELLRQLQTWSKLPKNRVQGQKYASVSEYLATHFILLREDCMHALRQGIQAMSQNKRVSDRIDLQIYKGARLQSIRCGKYGLEFRLSFSSNHRFSSCHPSSSKQLMEGSLVCMSHDGFKRLMWAIVTRPRKPSIDGDSVHLRLLESAADVKLDHDKLYTMVESPPAFFEAYCHVLGNLQKPEMTNLPFSEHIVFLEPHVDAPEYLTRGGEKRDEYDFACVFPEMQAHLKSTVFRVLQDWPHWSCSIDPSQMEAVRHGITKRLALIQGPPGTGKTFVGKVIVNILLNNLWKTTPIPSPIWEEEWGLSQDQKRIKLDNQELVDSPLLVLCYTNHALDQFLEGVFEFERNIIRYGGRSTSSKLVDCSVRQRLKKEKKGILRPIWDTHRNLCRRADKLRLEITRWQAMVGLDFVTFEPLRQVATPEQVDNLYFCGSNQKIVQLWLQGLDLQSAHQAIQREKHADFEGKMEISGTSGAPYPGSPVMFHDEENVDSSGNLNFDEPYVWMLGPSARQVLHAEWLKKIKELAEENLLRVSGEYHLLCADKTKADEDIQLSILEGARVIGMTTTAAARCHNILMQLRPKVIIVEEAAEILEAHVVACLTPYSQHLILIGDHLQLRPSVAINKLATDCHLDVSLFERLVSGGVEHVTLRYQRRMRPCISRLLRGFYPSLKDHDSVFGRRKVEGMQKNVFFLDHRSQERGVTDSKSRVNVEESRFVIELYLYILKQKPYQASDITILTTYRAQMQCIKSLLQEKIEHDHEHVMPEGMSKALLNSSSQITCVDDYQGEESNIIILSLVRNVCHENNTESIGFLDNPNRVCVALSRAREGLYMFGNAELLCSKSKLWCTIIEDLKGTGALGRWLTLVCPKHFLAETEIHEVKDFAKVIDGGCTRRCDHRLECGHSCPKLCHPDDHTHIVCPERCRQQLLCRHPCMQRCHGTMKCPPCARMVPQCHPQCGHRSLRPCSRLSAGFHCEEPCLVMLECGHRCAQKCGEECTKWCMQRVDKQLPCGHFANVPCYQPAFQFFCREACGQSLEPACKHLCQGKCTSCRGAKVHHQCCQQCEKLLPCGHRCRSLCYRICQPCAEPCENACCHRRCLQKCGDLCQPCEAPCNWRCMHFACSKRCHEVCNRPRCNQKCPNLLKCGHECIGLCGEPCPIRCRICHPNITEVCSLLPLKEMETSTRFVELADCGHLGEFNMLDDLVDNGDSPAEGLGTTWPKTCPKCNTPIRKTMRYRSAINTLLKNLEEAKTRVIERNYRSTGR